MLPERSTAWKANHQWTSVSKKSPTGPSERTPKKPEYLIARSQLTERGPLGFGPIQFLMDSSIIPAKTIPLIVGLLKLTTSVCWGVWSGGKKNYARQNELREIFVMHAMLGEPQVFFCAYSGRIVGSASTRHLRDTNFSGGWKNTTDWDSCGSSNEINQHVLLENVKIFQSFGSVAKYGRALKHRLFLLHGEMMYEFSTVLCSFSQTWGLCWKPLAIVRKMILGCCSGKSLVECRFMPCPIYLTVIPSGKFCSSNNHR